LQMVQSSSSSRARSKRVMNQTMFDVPDPLVVVHVLLCSHMSLCIIIAASLILGILMCPKPTDSLL
jgi:hypothetical protein